MIAAVRRDDRRERASIDDLTRRVQSEYDEMPGLCLTSRQARRLWGIDPESCAIALNALLGQGFLRRTHEGQYVRARH